MKNCKFCGTSIPDQAQFCSQCGEPAIVEPQVTHPSTHSNNMLTPDVKDTGLNILAFCFPWIGLIIYLVTKNETPKKAKAVIKSATMGFAFILAMIIVFFGIFAILLVKVKEEYKFPETNDSYVETIEEIPSQNWTTKYTSPIMHTSPIIGKIATLT